MMLVLVRSFSFTHHAMFGEVFLISFLMLVCTLMILVSMRSFAYTPDCRFSEEFLFYSLCLF